MKHKLLLLLCFISFIFGEGFNTGPQTTPPSFAANQRFLTYVEIGDVSAVENILQEQPEINVNVKVGEQGKTPLIIATEKGNEDMVQLLLKNGADPRIPSNGDVTPLQIAQQKDDEFIAGDIQEALKKYKSATSSTQIIYQSQNLVKKGVDILKQAHEKLEEALNNIVTEINALPINNDKKKELAINITNLMQESALVASAGYFAFN
jgi:ankyrin repeat protein